MGGRNFMRRRSGRWLLGLLLTLGSMPAWSAEDVMNYVVRQGDTLIGLGEALFEHPARWPVVQRLNGVADPRRIPVGSVLRIPVRLLRQVPREGQVVFVSGEASTGGRLIQAGMRIREGDRLETGERSFLTIELPDGSRLTLQPDTRARVLGLRGYQGFDAAQRADFDVESGRIETEVKPQGGPAARYRIHTPTAIIGVRGTSFRVASDGEVTRTEMREGTVEVSDPGGRRRIVRVSEGFGQVARAGKPLAAPVALLPAPDLSEVPVLHERPLLKIELAPVAGAVAYRAQVASDAGFTRILAEARSALPEVKVTGLPDGDYVLRARAIDSLGLEGRDAQQAFRLKARPEPPYVITPRPDGKVNAGEVLFSWSQAEGAARYRFVLSEHEDLSAPIASETALDAPRFTRALEAGTYYWRLASTRADGDQGPWGDPVAFTVRPPMAAVPPPSFDEASMFLAWSGEPGQRFDYQLADDEKFASLVASGTVDQPELRIERPAPGAYYLRVRAIDPDGFVGAYSATQQVIVPASLPAWLLVIPALMIAL
jgi:hypothetical protein